jgi:hypothetical protein
LIPRAGARQATIGGMRLLLPLLWCACDAPSRDAVRPVDGIQAGGAASPDGRWRAAVAAGGALSVEGPDGAFDLGAGALPELAFSPDSRRLVWPRQVDGPETELVLLELPPQGEPTVLLDWPGAEDRPVFSPDGGRLAFTSGKSGLASVYVLDLATGAVAQLTNVGLEDAPRAPGSPPDGWVPPPQAAWTWDGRGLSYLADGRRWELHP